MAKKEYSIIDVANRVSRSAKWVKTVARNLGVDMKGDYIVGSESYKIVLAYFRKVAR